MSAFIQNLQKRRSDYSHPDQATTQEQSLIQLSRGIYAEEERFVFELLQNAVDAYSKADGCLDIKLLLQDGYLVFMHNGDAFSERDIEGLCDVGNGNKMTDTKKIGYKGIGFKSVFMRSTKVTVESGGFCFKFDKDEWEGYWDRLWDENKYGKRNPDKKYGMPWQIIPIDAKPPISIDDSGYNVATYIQIDREEQLSEKISKLIASSQFLLFLMCKNIRMSFVHDGIVKCSINKKTEGDIVVLSSNGKVDSRWLLYINESVNVPVEVQQSIADDINTPLKLKEARSFDLSFAIALDEKGKFRKLENNEAVVYTYLPTSFKFGGVGFPFLINANFITDAGRQQLHKDSEWNKLIFSKIPGEFLSWISNISNLYDNYYEVLPQKSYGEEDLLQLAYAESMEKAIEEIAFIPSEKNPTHKLLAKDTVMDKMGIAEKISPEVLIAHINRSYNKSFKSDYFIRNIRRGSRIFAEYGTFIFDKQKLKTLFEDESSFENLTPELDVRLIDYLFEYFCQNQSEQDDLLNLLRETKFLLDDKNKLTNPVGLFFPSDYTEQNEMAGDAEVLNKEIFDAIRSNGELHKWLMKLGMEDLSDATFIKNVLCKSGYVTKENAIDVARFLYNCKIDIFEEVGSYYLSNISFLTKNGRLELGENLYIGSKYKPEIDIETAYDGDIFVSEEYAENNDFIEWGFFFRKMGLKDKLTISKITLKDTNGYSLLNQVKEKF